MSLRTFVRLDTCRAHNGLNANRMVTKRNGHINDKVNKAKGMAKGTHSRLTTHKLNPRHAHANAQCQWQWPMRYALNVARNSPTCQP